MLLLSEMKIIQNQVPNPVPDVVGVDLEIFEMEQRKLHRPTGHLACLTICTGTDVYLITDESIIQQAVDAIIDSVWVMHNASFDLFHLRRWAKVPRRSPDKLWDTMIWERMLWSGYYADFSLDDMVRRYFDTIIQKKLRKRFEKESSLDATLRWYAASDAFFTREAYFKQREELDRRPNRGSLQRLWDEEEGPCVEVFLSFKGFRIDVEKWKALADRNVIIRDKIKGTLPFNPASPKQVLAALGKKLGICDTQAATLEYFKHNPLVAQILEFRRAAKLAGTYGHKFLTNHLEADGCIHSHYWSIGAATGRSSSADPNMQNIPGAKEFRECFIAREGNILIVADYEQQETRILAHISGDATLTDMLNRGEDIHLEVARAIFREPNMTKDDPRRFTGKTLNLGISYGLAAEALSDRVNLEYAKQGRKDIMTKWDANEYIESYFGMFPGVKSYIEHYRFLGSRNGYVTTIYGRPMFINEHNKHWSNNAINMPIQGGAADQVKYALVLLDARCREQGLEFPVTAMIHDEIVLDVPANLAQCYRDLLETCMIDAGRIMFPSISWAVSILMGQNWGISETEIGDSDDEEV